jgi:glycoside/pentoside/hexuronide:cation symporter, GPH family
MPHESLINAMYFFVVVEVFFFANTIVQAPYEALQAEIASTSTDRVSLGSWKVLFGALGLVFALVISPLLIQSIGFSGMGLTLAAVAMASLYLCLFGLWRRGTLRSTTATPEDAPSLWESVRATLAHRPFRALAASYLFFTAGYMLLPSFLPYYVRVAFGASEERVTVYTAGVIVLVIAILPILARAVRHWGKRAVYAGSMLALAGYLPIAGIALFRSLAADLSLEAQSVAFTWLSGLGFAALFVLPGALMADVVDDDARRTGKPRAAIYYGMMQTLQKMAQAVAAGMFGLLLQLFGYSAEQPLGIQLVLPAAGALAMLAFLCIWRGYDLREAPSRAAPATPAAAPIARST